MKINFNFNKKKKFKIRKLAPRCSSKNKAVIYFAKLDPSSVFHRRITILQCSSNLVKSIDNNVGVLFRKRERRSEPDCSVAARAKQHALLPHPSKNCSPNVSGARIDRTERPFKHTPRF